MGVPAALLFDLAAAAEQKKEWLTAKAAGCFYT